MLLIALCAQAWLHAPAQRVLATVSLIWVMVQGAFGALTVTLKLMPLVVTLHLLGGLGLLALLTLQLAKLRGFAPVNAVQSNRVRPWLLLVMLAISIQIALGGWVSTNYAVLACQEFPSCLNGSWWRPSKDLTQRARRLLSITILCAAECTLMLGAYPRFWPKMPLPRAQMSGRGRRWAIVQL